jgi:hypothetical protein
MKCSVFFFAPLLAVLPCAIACNTAELSQPAPIDAGPPCEAKPPVVSCDADAGVVTPGACQGAVTLLLDAPDASNTIPSGSYPLGCTVGFFIPDPASADCLRAPSCTCVPPDAGADDGGIPEDAGATAPGLWSCFPAQ